MLTTEDCKYPAHIKHSFFGQISLPQSPRQETFWASAGFESTEKLPTLPDAPW